MISECSVFIKKVYTLTNLLSNMPFVTTENGKQTKELPGQHHYNRSHREW